MESKRFTCQLHLPSVNMAVFDTVKLFISMNQSTLKIQPVISNKAQRSECLLIYRTSRISLWSNVHNTYISAERDIIL